MPRQRRKDRGRVRPRRNRRRNQKRKRAAQGVTRQYMWFKSVLTVTSNPAGQVSYALTANNVTTAGDWTNQAQNWEEFKVLKVVTKLIPAAVGSESVVVGAAGGGLRPTNIRGDAVSWIDFNSNAPAVTAVADVINAPSARMLQPRRTHVRWMNRPRNYPDWGVLSNAGGLATPDNWLGTLNLYGDGFTPTGVAGPQRFFYAQQMFKVVFRGRRIR